MRLTHLHLSDVSIHHLSKILRVHALLCHVIHHLVADGLELGPLGSEFFLQPE